jgi:hypothetical protein
MNKHQWISYKFNKYNGLICVKCELGVLKSCEFSEEYKPFGLCCHARPDSCHSFFVSFIGRSAKCVNFLTCNEQMIKEIIE